MSDKMQPNWAAQLQDAILDNSGIRKGLHDDAAQPLLDWGLQLAKDSTQGLEALPSDQAQARYDDLYTALPKLLTRIAWVVVYRAKKGADWTLKTFSQINEFNRVVQGGRAYQFSKQEIVEYANSMDGLQGQAMVKHLIRKLDHAEKDSTMKPTPESLAETLKEGLHAASASTPQAVSQTLADQMNINPPEKMGQSLADKMGAKPSSNMKQTPADSMGSQLPNAAAKSLADQMATSADDAAQSLKQQMGKASPPLADNAAQSLKEQISKVSPPPLADDAVQSLKQQMGNASPPQVSDDAVHALKQQMGNASPPPLVDDAAQSLKQQMADSQTSEEPEKKGFWGKVADVVDSKQSNEDD